MRINPNSVSEEAPQFAFGYQGSSVPGQGFWGVGADYTGGAAGLASDGAVAYLCSPSFLSRLGCAESWRLSR